MANVIICIIAVTSSVNSVFFLMNSMIQDDVFSNVASTILSLVNLCTGVSGLVVVVLSFIHLKRQKSGNKKRYKALKEYAAKHPDNGFVSTETLRAMKHNHDRVDSALTEFGVTAVVNVFALVGLICVCSLAVVSIGLGIGSSANSVSFARGGWIEQHLKNSTCESQNAVYFAGYSSWDEMMENCCCRNATQDANRFLEDGEPILTEEWLCRNGNQKRVPRTATWDLEDIGDQENLIRNGYTIKRTTMVVSTLDAREFCAREFNAGWYLIPRCQISRSMDQFMNVVFLGNEDDTANFIPVNWDNIDLQFDNNELWSIRDGLW